MLARGSFTVLELAGSRAYEYVKWQARVNVGPRSELRLDNVRSTWSSLSLVFNHHATQRNTTTTTTTTPNTLLLWPMRGIIRALRL